MNMIQPPSLPSNVHFFSSVLSSRKVVKVMTSRDQNGYGNLHVTTQLFSHIFSLIVITTSSYLTCSSCSFKSTSLFNDNNLMERLFNERWNEISLMAVEAKKILTWLNWHWCFLLLALCFFSCVKISFIIFFSMMMSISRCMTTIARKVCGKFKDSALKTYKMYLCGMCLLYAVGVNIFPLIIFAFLWYLRETFCRSISINFYHRGSKKL